MPVQRVSPKVFAPGGSGPDGQSAFASDGRSFSIVTKRAAGTVSYTHLRIGRNPATGETIQIKAKRVVKFRVAKAAKDAILGTK